jgi:hypothetical protein
MDWNWIQKYKNNPNVVVCTHFPPNPVALSEYWKVNGVTLNPYFINTKNLEGFTLWVHGHTHNALDKISKKAKKIGAVNCITVSKKKKLKGYNTDYYGFKKSLKPLLKKHHTKALILGTGGASKAIAFALKKMNIEYDFVSRNPNEYEFSNISELKDAVTEYIEYYNSRRISLKLKGLTPIEYRNQTYMPRV